VIDVPADAMIEHGIPVYIRSDNGPEFVAACPAKSVPVVLRQTGIEGARNGQSEEV
jgi:hypothetical protein